MFGLFGEDRIRIWSRLALMASRKNRHARSRPMMPFPTDARQTALCSDGTSRRGGSNKAGCSLGLRAAEKDFSGCANRFYERTEYWLKMPAALQLGPYLLFVFCGVATASLGAFQQPAKAARLRLLAVEGALASTEILAALNLGFLPTTIFTSQSNARKSCIRRSAEKPCNL